MKNNALGLAITRFDLAPRCPDMGVKRVAVLFARRDSIYKKMPGCDVYDQDRDARTWPGGCSAITHPPCRGWGRLRGFASPAAGELDLAHMAVARVRQWGGVLEHPATSVLWKAAGLPAPGCGLDEFGGWSMSIPQFWFGHRADKLTWLYIVGCQPSEVPPVPFVLGEAPSGVEHLSRAAREATPPAFAKWLFDLATTCGEK